MPTKTTRLKPSPSRGAKSTRRDRALATPALVEPPRRLGVDARRAQLIALGRRLFVEHPYDVLSIDDIAKAAGISKGLLYHYFPSKRDFYVATVKDAAGQLLERTAEHKGLPPAEQAMHRIARYLDFVEENAGAFVTLMRSGIGHDPEVAEVVDGTRDALVSRILSNIGVGPRPAFRLALRSWVGLCEAASIEWVQSEARMPREVLAAFLLETLASCLDGARRIDPGAGFRLPSHEPAR